MYREGSEYITYTPVEAYGVSTFANGIISGGYGNESTITQNTRFFWVYNPDSPATSGFTGTGKWFCGVEYTPLSSITEEELINQFQNEGRTNLNDFFQKWQTVVDAQQPGITDYVGDFMEMIGNFDCFSMNG